MVRMRERQNWSWKLEWKQPQGPATLSQHGLFWLPVASGFLCVDLVLTNITWALGRHPSKFT